MSSPYKPDICNGGGGGGFGDGDPPLKIKQTTFEQAQNLGKALNEICEL